MVFDECVGRDKWRHFSNDRMWEIVRNETANGEEYVATSSWNSMSAMTKEELFQLLKNC